MSDRDATLVRVWYDEGTEGNEGYILYNVNNNVAFLVFSGTKIIQMPKYNRFYRMMTSRAEGEVIFLRNHGNTALFIASMFFSE